MKHILTRQTSLDGTETQLELFDDVTNTIIWIKCNPMIKDASFKESEIREK